MAIFAVGLLAAHPASAALVNCGHYDSAGNLDKCDIADLILTVVNIINFLLAWAWLLSMFFILWAAYTLIGSGGNEEAIAKGKGTFKNAIIGFFLIMAAYLLINWIIAALTGMPINTTTDALLKSFGIID